MIELLFVDDEQRVLHSMARSLYGWSDEWTCHYANSVDEALATVAARKLDAIVSDHNMPHKSGMDLLRIIRADEATQHLPFIMLTGNGDVNVRREALEIGATDFLSKPCDHIELMTRVRNAVMLKQYQDEICRQNLELEGRVRARTAELEDSRLEVIIRLARSSEARDRETGNHIIRVGIIAKALGDAVGLEPNNLFLTAPLHDIGKIGIPDRILLKDGPLDPRERQQMQEHCRLGADILSEDLWPVLRRIRRSDHAVSSNNLLSEAAAIALHHHERWDGSGYPCGLAGEEIPIQARIVSIADVYDALRSNRPYKVAFSATTAIQTIRNGAGTQFDPALVKAFTGIHSDLETQLQDLRGSDSGDLAA